MKLKQKYALNNDNISWRIIEGEAVILNLDNGFYYSLNKMGTGIWKLFKEGKSIEEIIDTLVAEYGAKKEEVKNDLADLLNDLLKENLIRIV